MNKAKAIEVINSKNTYGRATAGLHEALGVDFEKPFHFELIGNNFTINKAVKAASAAGYDRCGDMMLLICATEHSTEFNVVRISAGGSYSVYPFSYANGLSKFYAKCDFEEKRKRGWIKAYLFCQKASDLCEKKRKPAIYIPDTTSRYKFVEFRYSQFATLRRTDNNGEKFDYNVHKGINADNYNDYIDKSGYMIGITRENLNERLKVFKAERRKNEYMKTDNKERVNALGLLIATKHSILADEFKNLKTADQISKFEKKIDSWRGFGRVVSDYEEMKKKESEREYKSVESFESAYKSIMERLASI